jgi:hypothetical protein
MRSSGLEPPRAVKPTRPSTLRVYQFRHERRAREYILAAPASAAASGLGAQRSALPRHRLSAVTASRIDVCGACIRPQPPLQCEQVFVPGNIFPEPGDDQTWI